MGWHGDASPGKLSSPTQGADGVAYSTYLQHLPQLMVQIFMPEILKVCGLTGRQAPIFAVRATTPCPPKRLAA